VAIIKSSQNADVNENENDDDDDDDDRRKNQPHDPAFQSRSLK
jgi:hypothetical protein